MGAAGGYVSADEPCGVCRLDVKGGEIGLFKTSINKGFSDVKRTTAFFGAVPFNLENPYFYLLRKHVDCKKVPQVELID
jgi:hypothetical protein